MKILFQKLKYSLLVFGVLTASTVLSYIDFQPSTDKTKQSSAFSNDLDLSKKIEVDRRPATTQSQKNFVLEAKVFCDEQKTNHDPKNQSSTGNQHAISVQQPLVMLDLVFCESIKSQRHIWVRNNTNGFKAQVFPLKSNRYRTDFIQLNKGTNSLEIESVLKDGQKRVQALEIEQGS